MFELAAWAPEVSNQPPPPADNVGGLFAGLAIAIIVFSLVWYGMRRIRGRGLEGVRRTGGAGVGNALFELGAILQPDRPNIETILRIEEEGIEDEAGDGRDPERARTRRSPDLVRAPARANESGPDDALAFKPDADPADGSEHRGDDHRAAIPDALPPSVPRE